MLVPPTSYQGCPNSLERTYKNYGGNMHVQSTKANVARLYIAQKYDEIRDTMEKEPSLSRMEIAQKVFKSKSWDSVVGYGEGVKAKDIRGPSRTRVELEVELNATRKKK